METLPGATPRRKFLTRCAQALSLLFIPRWLRTLNAAPPAFHFHPQYREQPPLTPLRSKIDPALDIFLSEKLQAPLATLLQEWSVSLLQFPASLASIEPSLDPGFRGTSWQPDQSTILPAAIPSLTLSRLSFPGALLPKTEFLEQLLRSLRIFSRLLTAGFEITAITATGDATVRYELTGTGPDFHREQRTGIWTISWRNNRITLWQVKSEVRVRCAVPAFADIASAAFGAIPSYAPQFLRGSDDWRQTLDGASGIDIYGHNGVSAGDVYGAGRDDLYICQPAGLPNRLYRNRGDGTFEDVTAEAGVGVLDNTACALFADLTNNGRQDLIVVCANGPLLFHNQGDGTFRQQPNAFQFAVPPQGTFTGAALADYDRDGYLDIYFCLYSYYQGTGQYRYPTPYFAAENGPPNFLLRNNRDGTFRDVTASAGLNKNNSRFSFCCAWNDFNSNGWPDLYVVNDFGRKNLYRNNGGVFTDVAAELGVEDAGAGMSVCWSDFNRDGRSDLYVANMWTAAGERITQDPAFQTAASPAAKLLYRKHAMGNSLFLGAADSFRNVTDRSQTSFGRWSWSSDAWDFAHSGFPSLYVTNGMLSGALQPDLNSFFWRQVVAASPNSGQASSAYQQAPYQQAWGVINEIIREGYSWSGHERNVLFANNPEGIFHDVAGALGVGFLEDGRSFALADFDGDGRQELVLKNRNAPQLRLLQNNLPDLPPAIALRLQGVKSNRDGIGAAVTVETSAGRQTQFVQAGSGFLSQHSKELFFGLGGAKGNVSATIVWPSGAVQHLSNLPSNHRVWVTESSDRYHAEKFHARPAKPVPPTTSAPPLPSETWLLVPIPAPMAPAGKPHLLSFTEADAADPARRELLAIYNLLFRHIFDYHRDLTLPSSFLIDANGQIIKIYQSSVPPAQFQQDLLHAPKTEAERLEKALPFPGLPGSYNFARNDLSLGSVFFQHGYAEVARLYFQSALDNDAASAEALYGLGSVLLKQQQYAPAREYFERAAKLKAAYPETVSDTWNNLGLIAARTGDPAQAQTYFQRVLALDPEHFIALLNLGNAYRQQKAWTQAGETLERALLLQPGDPEANYALAMVCAQTGQTTRAYQLLKKALAARPKYPEALNNLGILYLRTHRPAEAIAAFQECIIAAPRFDQAYLNLAEVYSLQGDRAKALPVLQSLLDQVPDHPRARELRRKLEQDQ